MAEAIDELLERLGRRPSPRCNTRCFLGRKSRGTSTRLRRQVEPIAVIGASVDEMLARLRHDRVGLERATPSPP